MVFAACGCWRHSSKLNKLYCGSNTMLFSVPWHTKDMYSHGLETHICFNFPLFCTHFWIKQNLWLCDFCKTLPRLPLMEPVCRKPTESHTTSPGFSCSTKIDCLYFSRGWWLISRLGMWWARRELVTWPWSKCNLWCSLTTSLLFNGMPHSESVNWPPVRNKFRKSWIEYTFEPTMQIGLVSRI